MKNSKQPSELDVYYLNLKNGRLVLSPLEGIRKPDEIDSITIHASSNMLDEESRLYVEGELVHQAGRSVSFYMQERHYIPRLIISAVVFLLIYLFMSLVIRDPIPMVDELLIALAATVMTWVLLSRRDVKIALSSKLMLDLSARVHSAEVILDDEVDEIEAYMYSLYGKYSIPEMADILARTRSVEYPKFDGKISSALESLFKSYLEKKDRTLSAYLKMVRKNNGPDEKLSARLVQSATAEGLDLDMLLFLSQIL